MSSKRPPANETKKQMRQRHVKEVKEFKATWKKLPRAAKRSRNQKEEEAEQKERHKTEWNGLLERLGELVIEDKQEEEDTMTIKVSAEEKAAREKKAQEQAAQRQSERDARLERERKMEQQGPSKRSIERKSILEIIKKDNFKMKNIRPDGNCLYAAISDQLQRYNVEKNVKELRETAADYIVAHKDDFLQFMDDSNDFDGYIEKLRTTNEWGGQIELQALVKSLKKPIHIYSAESPKIIMGEEFTNDPLYITYHKHEFTLGEHYNSVATI